MKKIAVALLSVLALNAFASDESPVFAHEKVGTPLTRAQVIAELNQARAEGKIPVWNTEEAPAAVTSKSTLSRQEVINEYLRAKKSGELDKLREMYYN